MAKEGSLIHRECPSRLETITLGASSLAKKIRCPKCCQAVIISPHPVADTRETGEPGKPHDTPWILEPEEERILANMIESIEKAPQGNYVVCIKDLGEASGTYHISPNELQSLVELKKLLPGSEAKSRSRRSSEIANPSLRVSA